MYFSGVFVAFILVFLLSLYQYGWRNRIGDLNLSFLARVGQAFLFASIACWLSWLAVIMTIVGFFNFRSNVVLFNKSK